MSSLFGGADNEEKLDEKAFKEWLGDEPCAVFPRQHHKQCLGLRIDRPGKSLVVDYCGLDGEGTNTLVKFIIGVHRIREIEVEGRNLLKLLDQLKEHRVDSIRQADRDTYKDGQLYIKRIGVRIIPREKIESEAS